MIRKILKTVTAVFGIVALFVGLGYWSNYGTAPWFVSASWDAANRLIVEDDPFTRCIRREGNVTVWIGARACYDFEVPREFVGIFAYQFEGNTFIETSQLEPPFVIREFVRLEVDDKSDVSVAPKLMDRENNRIARLWRIRFFGRKSKGKVIGHLSLADHGILVDRVETAELIGEGTGYWGSNIISDGRN